MTQHLPTKIALIVAATVLLVTLTAAISIGWITRALDRQALEQSIIQVQIVRENILSQIDTITVDYSKWDWAFDAVRSGTDLEWIFGNIGSAALIGEAVQLAVIWNGGYEHELGWDDTGVLEPRSDLVSESTLLAIEAHLATVEPGNFDAVEFFQWREDELFAMAASHFEPVENPGRVPEDERFGGILLMGTRLDTEAMAAIAKGLSLTGTQISLEAPDDGPSIALPGLDGNPVAYLGWDRPRPGTAMLKRMTPFLILMIATSAVLGALNMQVARRGAQNLVLAEQWASRAARTDILTGLPNRSAFNVAVDSDTDARERAIIYLDIDDFKRVNDSIGHEAGDQVIVEVARRLTEILSRDSLLARIGGDEFVIVLTGPGAARRATEIALKAQETFRRPFNILGHQMRLRAAVGYAVRVGCGARGDGLVRQADLAMYAAKRHRGGAPVAFSSVLESDSQNAAVVERGLRGALERPAELSMLYQPITTMDGRMVRAEALVRWTSPTLGAVGPDRFIPVAERAGLIVDLGRKIVGLVCEDLVNNPDLQVSLNISPLQLMSPHFVPELIDELKKRDVATERIEIELTESVIVDDPALAGERLEELQAAGFSTALDDFGTGYSSMAYLSKMRFQTLKIDRSFAARVRGSDQEAAVIDGMIRIAHGLGLRVVCEGVESAKDCRRLIGLGCDFAQGYHFDRPLPIDALVSRWLRPSLSPPSRLIGSA